VSAGDFIAEEDIFIDANGKVVAKKDAQTKLASKGARVSPTDVEKYGLQPNKPSAVVREDGEQVIETKMMEPKQKKTRATTGDSAKEGSE
jgi:hypothetical protein